MGKNVDKNLSKDEQFALSTLIKNKDLVRQKADKDNTVVILNKKYYNLKMKKILKTLLNFINSSLTKIKYLIILSIWKIELFLIKKLKEKNQILDKKYKDLHPVGSRPGILCGHAKIHKPIKDGVPPFCPILSGIGTPTYKIAKFFESLLAPLTSNEYTIKDSFSFSEELLTFDSNLVMASFDIPIY